MDTTNWTCPDCGEVASSGHECRTTAAEVDVNNSPKVIDKKDRDTQMRDKPDLRELAWDFMVQEGWEKEPPYEVEDLVKLVEQAFSLGRKQGLEEAANFLEDEWDLNGKAGIHAATVIRKLMEEG